MARRREFSRKVRAEIILRATNERGQVCCERCRLILKKGAWEIDHTVAEALVVDKSKPLTAKDGQLLGRDCCHRGPDGKTADDIRRIRKADRQRDRDTGAMLPAKIKIRSAGFPRRKERNPKPSLPPVALFRRGELLKPIGGTDHD